MRKTLFPLVALFGALLVVCAPPAFAHDELVSSTPANGVTLTKLPRTVTLYFEEPPVAGFTHVTVTGPHGAQVASGLPVTHGAQVSVGVRRVTGPGSYVIGYRIMSDDGHPVSGTIQFRVGGAASAAKLTSSRRATSSDSVLIGGALGGVAVLVLGVAAVSVTRRRRVVVGAAAGRPAG